MCDHPVRHGRVHAGSRGPGIVGFPAAGVIGACIPFVASFFALQLPTGRTLVATLMALAMAAVIFALCLFAVPKVWRIVEHRHAER